MGNRFMACLCRHDSFHRKFESELLVKVRVKQQKKNGRGTGPLDIDSYRCLYLPKTEEPHEILKPPTAATGKEKKKN